jgi:methylase of polypeptide subunit release factors
MNASMEYYKLPADEIYDDICDTNREVVKAEVEGISLVVFPHVYPSHQFRTTGFVLRNLKKLVKGKKICDMGCGPGIVGLFSLHHEAELVAQVDINPIAIENAKKNNVMHGFSEDKIKTYLSNCFDNVPKDNFDLIIFNMPYHCDNVKIDDPLKYAFYDPAFVSIKKFLLQAREYSHEKTQIFIAFSNKGETGLLEKIFEQNQYEWKLWKITNADQEYDNRIYLLTLINDG